MEIERRLKPLEGAQGEDGLPACVECESGEKIQLVFQMEGHEPFPPLPTCPRCGRCIAYVVSLRTARAGMTEQPFQLNAALDTP